MNSDNSRVGIVFVNYHSEDLIRRCLESLNPLAIKNLLFVVVDNSEHPETTGLINQYPEVKILRPEENIGFAGGCNMGIQYLLKFEINYILLLNPDVRAEHDFISPLLEGLKKCPDLGMIGPKIIADNNRRDVCSAPGKINWWLGGLEHVNRKIADEKADIVPVQFLCGTAMMLRREAIKSVGLMNEDYFLYLEDTDYARMFISKGWGVGYMPKAEVLHVAASTTGYQSERYVYYFSRNRIWFMRRWAKWYHYLVFMLYDTFIKLPGAVIVFGLYRCRPRLALAFIRGYIDGLRPMGEKGCSGQKT